ncbi:hypothetical protein BDQ17DRAFT_1379056 [Cyathus striatus]|nr:hypothetical protein BDQ17DRAFT_1379056 [Cyathus striatus]
MGIIRIPGILSYAWVAAWMTVSCPMWMETTISGKYLAFIPTISVIEIVLHRFGFA